jgi:hypothetical protein
MLTCTSSRLVLLQKSAPLETRGNQGKALRVRGPFPMRRYLALIVLKARNRTSQRHCFAISISSIPTRILHTLLI